MQFEAYLQLEPRADLLRNYELALVPGPHQTEEYAFHSIASMRPELSPAQVRGLTDVRMDRQQKIAEGPLREFQALIEEQALRRMVGDRNIMRGQLEHLVDASEDPRNSLRVLAESLGCHPGLAGGFMLMRFPEATPDVVWLETMNRTVYFDEEADVDCYVEVFSDLWGRALDPAGTRARLTKMIKEL